MHRHVYRGQVWYVLEDPVSGGYQRLTMAAYRVIGLFDGSRTVQRIWETLAQDLGDDAPTQDEIIHLLGELNASDLLQSGAVQGGEEIHRRQQRARREKWLGRLRNPVSQRFALVDPDAFLEALAPWLRPVFGPVGFIAWLTVAAAALVLAWMNWPALAEHFSHHALSPKMLLLMAVAYPIVKLVHELGHGVATKVWGGEVREMGVMLLAFMPIPYVDASAASTFAEKSRRMVVGAAGIMVEVLFAAGALFVWLEAEAGWLRDGAFAVMVIGGFSTLLFNGNPLLRFDGYYVLADAIEIPNLGSRATRYLGYLVERYVFGVRGASSPASAPGEAPWLFGYGIASMAYRLVVLVAIVLYVAGKFFVVGVVLAIWALTAQVLLPVCKSAGHVFASPRLARNRLRAIVTTGLGAAFVVALIGFVRVPHWSSAQGVVWLPEQAHVRAGADGFLLAMQAAPDDTVQPGATLFRLATPLLEAEIALFQAELAELEARLQSLAGSDRARAEIAKDAIDTARAKLERAEQRQAQLVVRSQAEGVLVVPNAQSLEGRYVRQGDVLGYVVAGARMTVRVAVDQANVTLVRERTLGVDVKFADRLERSFAAEVEREVPAANDKLPSRVLGSAGGGAIDVNPADDTGLEVLKPIFQLDLAVPGYAGPVHYGTRVHVRFDHGTDTLAQQWWRELRQVFLRRFSV
ncbi:MAG: efflux RND transporter periplasmic adaptor subunit [Gammaproteobacteria bacterium]